jgi:hypothetical protein
VEDRLLRLDNHTDILSRRPGFSDVRIAPE